MNAESKTVHTPESDDCSTSEPPRETSSVADSASATELGDGYDEGDVTADRQNVHRGTCWGETVC